MAKIENIIRHILKWEAGVTYNELDLRQLYAKATRKGWSNHPLDRGGPTMCGVTLNTYKTYNKAKGLPNPTVAELKALTYDEWKGCLKMYWDYCKADKIENQSIANLVVDWYWGSGKAGIKLMQKAIGVYADGVIGRKTLAALNKEDTQSTFDAIYAARAYHFHRVALNYNLNIFLNGWLARLADLHYQP